MNSQTTEIGATLIENFAQVCRLCLSEKSLEDIFKQLDLIMWISEFLSIVVSEEDKISRFICASCQSRLHEFREYQLRCLEVQDVLLSESTAIEVEGLSLTKAKEAKKLPEEDPKQTIEVQEEEEHIEPNTDENEEEPKPNRLYKRVEVDESGRKKYTYGNRAVYLRCSICGKKVLEYRMEGHKNNHLGLRPYQCEHGCENVEFNCRLNRQKHYRNIHGGEQGDQYECDICHKSYRTKYNLYYHKRGVHMPKTFVCRVCNKAFTTSSRLTSHSKSHSVRERTHQCSICSLSFLTKYILRKHMKKHSEKIQGKDLVDAENSQIETVADPEIPEDTSTFIQEDSFVAKQVKIEPGVDPDPEVMENLFEAGEAKIEPESDNEQPTDVQPSVVQPTVEKVRCSNCGKNIHEADKETHLNCHLGIQSYKSERICENAGFPSDQLRLTQGEKVHETYECDICHRTYQHKQTVMTHKRKSHGIKNFSCVCGRSFTYKTHLTQHKRASNCIA